MCPNVNHQIEKKTKKHTPPPQRRLLQLFRLFDYHPIALETKERISYL